VAKFHNTKIKRIVIKIGTSLITDVKNGINKHIINNIAREICLFKKKGIEAIIVTSGSVGCGMHSLGLMIKPKSIQKKQAIASIGQGILINTYKTVFKTYKQLVAQVLLTHDDVQSRTRYLNARNTLLTLLRLKATPIINENDTVAIEELRFGDNDSLSAMVTNLVDADLLIILTDIEGLYDKDPRIHKDACIVRTIKDIDKNIEKMAGKTKGISSTGGMYTKVQAAKKVTTSGIYMVIADGRQKNILSSVLRGNEVGTVFMPKETTLSSKKKWIAFDLVPKGDIVVDEGAKKAVMKKDKSLLPSGITALKGIFSKGDAVNITDAKGAIFAKGLANYNSDEIKKIKGQKSSGIKEILGYTSGAEIVHRRDCVILDKKKLK
jgi:glutamate 5-kinase